MTSGGQVFTNAKSTAFSTSVTTPTAAAGSLNDGSSGGTSSGLSESGKNALIGVLVGVGGALILGGLGFVLWRLYGQKKRRNDDDDILMGGTGGPEKFSNDSSPFRSNLDQYHNPAGQVNTASNF